MSTCEFSEAACFTRLWPASRLDHLEEVCSASLHLCNPSLSSFTAEEREPARASGNYMVRNTPFSRDFLMRWAKYYDRRPKGFSSADNGAIQLVAPGLRIITPHECMQSLGTVASAVCSLLISSAGLRAGSKQVPCTSLSQLTLR